MPTQSQPSPISRLAPLRRLPFWAQALALCALFAIVGVVVLDDYSMIYDDFDHRRIAHAHARYIAKGDISELSQADDIAYRYYGMGFEITLLMVERALSLQDTRHIYLTRHLIIHLFFIAGGFACGMLAYRMLGNPWIALFAMLMFLLHPRLYAHSFFNPKDVPFAATLLIALYLTHRAFRKDTLGAFLLCGIAIGLAINLRPFGLMLPPMILAMRAPDLWQASRADRMRILASAGIFLAAALAVVYIIHPYYWENPLRFIEGIRALSQHPSITPNLFMGEIYWSDAVPWNYIPVWFAITAPPVALPLGALGAAAVCWQAISRPLAALRDREIRFRILTLGYFVAPIVVVIALQSNIYQGWRQMYFLWAPFCLLAAVGLHSIANIRMGGGIWKKLPRLPGWVRGGGRLHMARRTLAYGAAGFGLITTLSAMAALHPYEHVYFNALTDTKTPGALSKRYDMDYWSMSNLQSLKYLLARYPDDVLLVRGAAYIRLILPQSDRERIISFRNPHTADFYLFNQAAEYRLDIRNLRETRFYLHPRVALMSAPEQSPLYAVHAYGSVIASIVAKDVAAYHDVYDDVAANGTSLARSDFDIYEYDGALYYLSADCAPPAPNVPLPQIFLRIFPTDRADLPVDRREYGFENLDFRVDRHGAFFAGECIGRRPLPDYPISWIKTGQRVKGELIWSADIGFAAQALYESVAAGDYGNPFAQSRFDLYLSGNRLAYLKEPCAPGDTDARFFLHIFPADPADLPAVWREYGFVNLDFRFADYGGRAADKCVAERELPDYPIERIRTGQFVSGEGAVWRTEFAAGR